MYDRVKKQSLNVFKELYRTRAVVAKVTTPCARAPTSTPNTTVLDRYRKTPRNHFAPVRFKIEQAVRVKMDQPVKIKVEQPVAVKVEQPVAIKAEQPVALKVEQPLRLQCMPRGPSSF
jgi:hypothetical protein